MDNRPIGVFDSGVGGLTAARALVRVLPGENIIYFGDSGRMPYGTRPKEEIVRMALEDASYLARRGVKALIAACNTIDANALPALQSTLPMPVCGVISPAAGAAAGATKTGRIGVISTPSTAESDAYGRALREIDAGLSVTTVGCPSLAALVERGRTELSDPELLAALTEYLAPIKAREPDVLILGCTHYPLLARAIGAMMGENVALIDSGAAGAEAIADKLRAENMLAEREHGTSEFNTSGNPEAFAAIAAVFLRTPGRIAVSRVSL